MSAQKADLATVAHLAKCARSVTEQRDQAIAEAVASGASLRVVAEAAGMSHGGIARVVKRTRV
jgi:hypothetical protein